MLSLYRSLGVAQVHFLVIAFVFWQWRLEWAPVILPKKMLHLDYQLFRKRETSDRIGHQACAFKTQSLKKANATGERYPDEIVPIFLILGFSVINGTCVSD
ncbi:MAG: hypothetical protein K0Q59_4507 [Paenibacillus sp.]|nr:hypothetical protein [Paenibacillus sp.]